MKESFKKKLVRGRLKWARRVERMGDEKLAESRFPKGEGNRRRGRPKLRWDCIKRDLEKVGKE